MKYISVLVLVTGLMGAGHVLGEENAASMSLEEKHERAAEVLRNMLSPEIAEAMVKSDASAAFGGDMTRLAYENAYVQLWSRPGLSAKQRSLVTISMLIAMGNEKELAIHMAAGLRNGISVRELEEVIYHATAYTGFPHASDALAVARKVLAQE